MKKLYVIIVILLVVFTVSCKDKKSHSNSYESESYYNSEDGRYSDDTYCAEVEYYNPNTGTRSTYTLNVDVESNEVTKIHFSAGWLDSSEFSSEELDEDGYCSITCYDGRQFEIQITGSECSFTDESRMQSDVQDNEEAVTCPECGDEKDEYDEYCYSCKRKFTCPDCGDKKYKYDDLCYDCERKITCPDCGGKKYKYDDFCDDCQRDKEQEENNDY